MLQRGASELLELHQVTEGSTRVIEVSGEIDVYTAPLLDSAIKAACEATRIVIDLTDCRYVDASGLSLLVKAHQKNGDRLALIVSGGLIEKLLRITGLDQKLPLVASRQSVEKRSPFELSRV